MDFFCTYVVELILLKIRNWQLLEKTQYFKYLSTDDHIEKHSCVQVGCQEPWKD